MAKSRTTRFTRKPSTLAAESPVVAPVSVLPPDLLSPPPQSADETVAARQALERDKQLRAEATRNAVEDACQRFRCKVVASLKKVDAGKGTWVDAADVVIVAMD